MNGNEWSNYLYDLHQYIQQQDTKIKNLESRLKEIESQHDVKQGTTIEKIEYNFDQLKIERLDGTLHIGLSPNDLENIDDLGISQVPSETNEVSIEQKINSHLRQYIYQEGPTIIHQLTEQYQYPIDEHFQSVMLKDIEQQLPERISIYKQEARQNNTLTSENQEISFITDRIKQEIHQSLVTYMQGNETKEEEQ